MEPYYRDVLLSQQLLPAICQVSDELLIVQQDSASAHNYIGKIPFFQFWGP